ncbi:hypothetical protein O3667_07305 [Rothia mucilaginosa]|uniref:hypothetical protein n=1 Tax=Rothia mucilaginosa TaxID=43675 RepID=UPI00352F80EC
MSELSRRHVCRLSSFALVSFFVAPQSTAWGIQGSVGSPQQIDGCTVAPLREAWLPTNGADNVILWFQLLPFSGPYAGVHALPSVDLMGDQGERFLYEVIRPHIHRDTGQWLSKIPSGQQIVVELEQLSGSQEYMVQMSRWQPGSMGLTSHSPEGYPAAPSLTVREDSGLKVVRARGASTESTEYFCGVYQGEMKGNASLGEDDGAFIQAQRWEWGLEVDKDISQPEELFQRGCFGVYFPGRSEYGGSTASASYRISVRTPGGVLTCTTIAAP